MSKHGTDSHSHFDALLRISISLAWRGISTQHAVVFGRKHVLVVLLHILGNHERPVGVLHLVLATPRDVGPRRVRVVKLLLVHLCLSSVAKLALN